MKKSRRRGKSYMQKQRKGKAIEERIKVAERRGRRRKQLLDDLKETWGQWKLKEVLALEEARTCHKTDYGVNKWMNDLNQDKGIHGRKEKCWSPRGGPATWPRHSAGQSQISARSQAKAQVGLVRTHLTYTCHTLLCRVEHSFYVHIFMVGRVAVNFRFKHLVTWYFLRNH